MRSRPFGNKEDIGSRLTSYDSRVDMHRRYNVTRGELGKSSTKLGSVQRVTMIRGIYCVAMPGAQYDFNLSILR